LTLLKRIITNNFFKGAVMSYKSILNVVVVAVVVMAVMFVGCGGKKDKDASGSAKSGDSKSQVEKVKSGEKAGKGVKFTDKRDGKKYKTVKIGTAVWMAENLNYAAKGSKCYNNSADSCEKYGRLYNWETALKACPAGFHLPSDDEWKALEDSVEDFLKNGTKIKSGGKKLKSAAGWNNDGNGTNDFGWSALPGGVGGSNDDFINAGYSGHWWSATEQERNTNNAWYWNMNHSYGGVGGGSDSKTNLRSVRCVQDN
jgi:uncharacterized protein (TIGR02145 family)